MFKAVRRGLGIQTGCTTILLGGSQAGRSIPNLASVPVVSKRSRIPVESRLLWVYILSQALGHMTVQALLKFHGCDVIR